MTQEDLKLVIARFELIKQSLSEVAGKNLAFGAASAAWLMCIQRVLDDMLSRLTTGRMLRERRALEEEIEVMLRSFHGEICKELEIDPEEAIKLSDHFREVMRIIINWE